MEWLAAIPVWLLCLMIFLLRVADVTLGTLRTVAIVKGRITPAVVLGFFELIIWVAVISQVISRLHESWWLALAYAAGFAAGNGVGLSLERRLSRGTVSVRLLSQVFGEEIAKALRHDGHSVTTFEGRGEEGPVTLVYALTPRRSARRVIDFARGIDTDVLYVIEPAQETNGGIGLRLRPIPYSTGWRAVFKKK